MEIDQISIEYLSPSRTVEKYMHIKKLRKEPFYIYNYEGIHFRFFKDHLSLSQFFNNGIEPDHAFLDEEQLDHFLTMNNLI